VLEFGDAAPMAEYLRWLASVLESRGIPATHVPLSLEWLAEFYAQRLPHPDGAAVEAVARAAIEAAAVSSAPLTAIHARQPAPWPESAEFEAALLAGDRSAASALVEGLLTAGRSLMDIELHLIQPALYGIGRQWQENRVSVAQEHLATAIAQSVMALGLMKSRPAPPLGRKVLLACVEGNHHDVGLHMVADAYLLAGWDVQYLGADVPTSSLVRQVQSWKPHLVGLSVAFAHQLHAARKAIRALEEAIGAARPPVILGGLAINAFGGLAGSLGAQGSGPDAAAAIGAGAALVPAGA